jgi:hypothetical protein
MSEPTTVQALGDRMAQAKRVMRAIGLAIKAMDER